MSRTARVIIDPDENLVARELRLRRRILDAVEQTLDDMARSDAHARDSVFAPAVQALPAFLAPENVGRW